MHVHCNEDPVDRFISHSAKELIDYAAKLKFNVISITCHNKVVYSKSLQEYANKKKILLIPGTERDIDNKHVLLYNFTQEEVDKIKSFEDLRKIKKPNQLVIAPHPFYVNLNPISPAQFSLFKKLEENIDLFDGIEFCHLYTKRLNLPNNKARNIAKKYKLPLVGGSDSHNLDHMGSTFSFIDAKPNIRSVFNAIKKNKIKVCSRPRNLYELTNILAFFTTKSLKQKIFNSFHNNLI